MHKLRENAEKELKMIEEKGLSSSNLDNAYKLVEIMKGVDKIEMMQDGGYSQEGYSRDMEDYGRDRGGYSRNGDYPNGYDNGNSYLRGRNQRNGQYMHRPNYSRLSGDEDDMDRYREMKRQYSSARDGESKGKMLDALEDFMCGIHGLLKQIYRDSDTGEEREIIRRHAREIAEM